mmetsp:Transcript_95877/g.240304  ORF Transcript_95877/g.240304 Transcript_95877/m.240304 type:complete len:346 (+) Transcript_95877:219-1256(+)
MRVRREHRGRQRQRGRGRGTSLPRAATWRCPGRWWGRGCRARRAARLPPHGHGLPGCKLAWPCSGRRPAAARRHSAAEQPGSPRTPRCRRSAPAGRRHRRCCRQCRQHHFAWAAGAHRAGTGCLGNGPPQVRVGGAAQALRGFRYAHRESGFLAADGALEHPRQLQRDCQASCCLRRRQQRRLRRHRAGALAGLRHRGVHSEGPHRRRRRKSSGSSSILAPPRGRSRAQPRGARPHRHVPGHLHGSDRCLRHERAGHSRDDAAAIHDDRLDDEHGRDPTPANHDNGAPVLSQGRILHAGCAVLLEEVHPAAQVREHARLGLSSSGRQGVGRGCLAAAGACVQRPR